MAERVRVLAAERVATAPTQGGLERDDLVGRQQRALMALVAGLAAAPAAGRRMRRGVFDREQVGRWRPGGVGGVLAQPLPQLIDLLLKGAEPLLVPPEQGQDRGLGGRRHLPPEFL